MTMSATHEPFTRLSLSGVFARLGGWIAEMREERRRRRAVAALARLEPWQLEDVGITPTDLDRAMELPLYVSAGHALGLIASERRAREWADLKARRAERAEARRAGARAMRRR